MKKIILFIRDKFKFDFKGELDKIRNRTVEPLSATFSGPQRASFLDKKSRAIFFYFDDVIPDREIFCFIFILNYV